MGSSVSKSNPREPPVTWRAAIWRRLQIWEELKPYLIYVIQVVGRGRTTLTLEPPPLPPQGPPSTNGEDKVVSIVEMMLVEALRAAATKDADDRSAEQITGEQAGGKPAGASKPDVTLLRVTRALGKRLVKDPKEPKPGVQGDGEDDGHDHDHDQVNSEPDDAHDDEGLVAQFVRSSLEIALPRIGKSESNGQVTQTQSTPFNREGNSSIGLQGTSPSATPYPTLLQPGYLPAAVQKELETKQSNYLTWDKMLYTNLRLDAESIRLVEIRPGSAPEIEVDLIKKPLNEAKNTYEALSYTWGPPTPKETIVVNGVNVQINQSLFGALSSLRLPNAKRCLWVDAICINQASIAERSIEVQKMGEIYRLAKTVVIFHGWPSTTTREGSLITALFKFLTRSDHNSTPRTESSPTSGTIHDPFQSCGLDKALVCKGFIDFCCRPWWRRVWTMQEFYLATEEPVWYWGSTGVSNTTLKRDMPLLMSASWELYGQKEVESWIPKHVEAMTGKPVAQFNAEIRRIFELIGRRNRTHGFDIPSRLYRSLSAQATDPRDLVYGLREIFDPVFRRVFVPDYFMQLELLYACLAVFLIQFEGWGDMLWWYPYRSQVKGLLSWVPDFTRRVVPAETELLPRDHLAAGALQLKLVVLNHKLHVEGYKLDAIEAFTPITTATETDLLRDLWRFDSNFNRNRSHLAYDPTEEEQKNPWFRCFLTICRTMAAQDNSGISHPSLSVLDWTVKSNMEDEFPSAVVECLPCWDILMWHAFKIGSKSATEQFEDGDSTMLGILEDIFSANLRDVFRKILATDFIGDCVFDWHSLEHVLDRLASAAPWSNANGPYWQTATEARSSEQDERGKALATNVSSFLASLQAENPESMGDLHRFHRLCSLVILDSSQHTTFVHILGKLRSAGEQLRTLSLDWRVQAHVDELESKDEIVAARVRQNNAVKAHFSGRSLFRTRRGFHGLTAPGTDLCEGAEVLLLNGLSFPMLVTEFNQKECSGRLVGCANVRGIDLRDSKAKAPKIPDGFVLEEKRLFKFA